MCRRKLKILWRGRWVGMVVCVSRQRQAAGFGAVEGQARQRGARQPVLKMFFRVMVSAR